MNDAQKHQVEILRLDISELETAVRHLEKTNKELGQQLVSGDEDEDSAKFIKEVLEENKAVSITFLFHCEQWLNVDVTWVHF